MRSVKRRMASVEKLLLDYHGQDLIVRGRRYHVTDRRPPAPSSDSMCGHSFFAESDVDNGDLWPFGPHLHVAKSGRLFTVEPSGGRLIYVPTNMHLFEVEFMGPPSPWEQLADGTIRLL